MRPRKWVLVLFFIFLTSFAVLYLMKKRLEKNRDLESLLIQNISPYVKGSIGVGKIRLGFFSAHLHNVSLTVPLESFLIRINHIKVGFSFKDLLVSRGDFSKAINRIIFIDPEILFSIASNDSQTNENSKHLVKPSGAPPSVPDELPVSNIMVKNGKILLADNGGDTVIVGQKMRGTLTDFGNYTSVNLAGRSGSSHENFCAAGTIGWQSGVHTFNFTISKAHIEKPVTLSGGIITSGILDGNLSVMFSDTLSVGRIRTNGTISIKKGSVVLEQLPAPLESVSFHATASEYHWTIDTLRAHYKQSDIRMNGFWNSTGVPIMQFDFICSGIRPDSLLPGIPGVNPQIGGQGWIAGMLIKTDTIQPVKLRLRGEGFNIAEFKNIRFQSAGTVENTFSSMSIDTVSISDGNAVIEARGKVELDSPYVFNFEVSGHADTLPSIKNVHADNVQVDGKVWGSIVEPKVSARLSALNISTRDLFIGDQSVMVEYYKSQLRLNAKSSDGIVASVEVSEPFSKAPFAKMQINAQVSSIKSMLKRNHYTSEIESGYLDARGQGWVNDFDMEFSTAVKTKKVEGEFIGMLRKYRQDSNFVYWKCNRKTLKIDGVDIELTAAGSACKDSLVIDTFNIAGGLDGRGIIHFTSAPFEIEGSANASFPVKKLLGMNPKWSSVEVSGTVSGHSRIFGTIDNPQIRSEVRIRKFCSSGFDNIETDAIVTWKSDGLCIQPFVIRKNNQILASFDSVKSIKSGFSLSGDFESIDARSVLAPVLPRDLSLTSTISGSITTSGNGFPIQVQCFSPSVVCNKWSFDSVSVSASLDKKGIGIRSLKAQDGTLMYLTASGFLPWSLIDNNLDQNDTVKGHIDARGDFLAYLAKNVESPIAGRGPGTARFSFVSTPGVVKCTEGIISIPEGVLTLKPIVLDDIKNFSFTLNVDTTLNVHTSIAGTVKRRGISISSNHTVPDGFEPFEIGPFNFGMLQVKTPDKGIDIHLPGFMPVGELGDIEFLGKSTCQYFTVSGPVDKLRITGTWVVRDLDFTFPFLNTNEIPWDFDIFPYVTWDFDLKPGNRRVLYFWDLSGKRRRILRFLEGYIDPTSIVKIRGRDLDYSFRLYGTIRSLKGALYYGKTFDRNFDAGLDFVPIKLQSNRGYDNLPILWGSAEALSDTSRLNRIKVTCMVHNPATSGVSEKGRLAEGKTLNVSFQLSNDFEGLPGESEHEFYRQAGLQFTSLGGAGELVSGFGEQFFHRYLLQRWERKLAKKLGVDVINIESSITSNYFSKLYSRQFEGLWDQDDYLALANVGITVGRYFFHDYLFFKARGELVPIDTTLLKPQYSVGMEFQPNRYLIMDFNYGIHKGDERFEHDPRVMMQLTLPMSRIRKLLKF
ncbi:MAG TPA: hypothetical protein VHO70_06335 [Chitinispirillaceae bacterium]|nr:hypothetical protein [Chitinispirillaceae bacterium]